MSGWISVKINLPDEHPHRFQAVIGCKSNGAVGEYWYNSKTKSFHVTIGEELSYTITHWMPLPLAYNATTKENR